MSVLIVSLHDDASLLKELPFDVIKYIGRLFYQPVANINALSLPERVISPFWPQLSSEFEEKFSFLSI